MSSSSSCHQLALGKFQMVKNEFQAEFPMTVHRKGILWRKINHFIRSWINLIVLHLLIDYLFNQADKFILVFLNFCITACIHSLHVHNLPSRLNNRIICELVCKFETAAHEFTNARAYETATKAMKFVFNCLKYNYTNWLLSSLT